MHLSQISRQVEDLARARAFWAGLGAVELYAFPGLAFVSLGQVRLMLRETGRRDPADLLYLAVPDIEAAFAALPPTVTRVRAPQVIHRHPDGTAEWMAFFQDDEGRDLAFHAVAPPAAP